MSSPWWWDAGPAVLGALAFGLVVGYIWGLGRAEDVQVVAECPEESPPA